MDLRKVRQQYERPELKRETLNADAIEQLKDWMDIAIKNEISYANAATLATLDKNGFPQARVILIKEIENNNLTFFTNYESEKAKDIKDHNKVSLNIYWKELDRQVRILGVASKTSEQVSKDYFYSRPKESQISAIASAQSSVVTKEELYAKVKELEEKFVDKEVEFPNFWGGYQVEIEYVEFWQGRPNRLHDRFAYSKDGAGWKIDRLAP